MPAGVALVVSVVSSRMLPVGVSWFLTARPVMFARASDPRSTSSRGVFCHCWTSLGLIVVLAASMNLSAHP